MARPRGWKYSTEHFTIFSHVAALAAAICCKGCASPRGPHTIKASQRAEGKTRDEHQRQGLNHWSVDTSEASTESFLWQLFDNSWSLFKCQSVFFATSSLLTRPLKFRMTMKTMVFAYLHRFESVHWENISFFRALDLFLTGHNFSRDLVF